MRVEDTTAPVNALSSCDLAGVRLSVEPVQASVWLDSDRMMQTLTNLLGNAIKFSPSGTTVTLSGSADASSFVFRVADEGRGIPAGKLESIFERFQQDVLRSRCLDRGIEHLLFRSDVHGEGVGDL